LQARADIPTVGGAFANLALGPFRRVFKAAQGKHAPPSTTELKVLQPMSGVVRPGTMTM
jgi:hypothetical protein